MRKSAGFTLIEMLCITILLGAFSVLAAQLFMSSMAILKQAQRVHEKVDRLEGAMALLRADAWNGVELAVGDPSTVLIRFWGDRRVVWRVEGATLQRSLWEGQRLLEKREWPLEGSRLSFGSPTPGTLAVRFDPKGPPLRLASQITALEGSRP